MAHYLYLVRHGEQQDAEHGLPDGPLSPKGQRQARAIADRLGGVPFSRAWHSPLERAAQTAAIMTERLPALTSTPSSLLMDCIPSGPTPDMPHAFEPFFGSVTPEQIEAGEAQMADAVAEFLAPAMEDRHDLLITHNFVIAWFVREVFGAPSWRWLGLNQANCGLTIIRVRSAKPPVLVTHNDLGHLPAELRTGLPQEQPF
ncbi:MAG TPA: histidine phosphatase family protein [Rhodoglobus sp.]|jgi:broad specificity phosphatase PhoE|nr:histidine phosphatase family protein [Rhodoglobus sp.]HPU03045.1 histidine phosphatase family protein [Rhodoglobus sp.]HQA24386.1 histidine phosphatase family protein [Rhodoglobus sp.]HQG69939.1 histidine phosphatase family protein [Rhodoglobus sp.]HQJ34677.1 histidine phosphatase family protein [Rhodoglobus sp.]